VLAVASYATVAYLFTRGPAFGFSSSPLWMAGLRMTVAPAVSLAALALPIAALIALLFRRFHATLLVGMAVCVLLLLAYVGLEAYWVANPASPSWPAAD
jgi:hypothetical protein